VAGTGPVEENLCGYTNDVDDAYCHPAVSGKVYCGKMADWIWMTFGIVSGVSRGMVVLDVGGDHRRERSSFVVRKCGGIPL